MIERTFKISFIKYDEPAEFMCDFCENRPTLWYSEDLTTGYCKECMDEQEKVMEEVFK